MKIFFLFCLLFSTLTFVIGQSISSSVEIYSVYSQNEKFYLKTIPYDNESPSLRGKTYVYQIGNQTPVYAFERGFDSLGFNDNFLILSNDGETIFFAISYGEDEQVEGLRSVNIYKHGKVFKSYTRSEVTGCNLEKERCDLVYYNGDDVIDEKKSNWGTRNYKRVFKDGINDQEKFLADFPIFASDDYVYITDSKKQTHIFNLRSGELSKSVPFESVFQEIKAKGRSNKITETRYNAPSSYDFPKLKNGKNTELSLAQFIGMKPFDIYSKRDEQFRRYSFEISINILRDGSLEIESDDIGKDLPREKILEFFKTSKFDTTEIPKVFPKWHISQKIFFLRNASDVVARKERKIEIIEEREQLKKRLLSEKIGDRYIPKDLADCFIELDKLLSEVDKKEMRELKSRDDMIKYHMGLGMWMRNNWGLWGGSRLQKYFGDRKVHHPDSMSSVVLYHYFDWLNGSKETWKDWEKNPK
jgi:hypothetical protein